MYYKWCAVPGKKTPEKLFITVPKSSEVRNTWLLLARRDPKEIKESSVIFFCQDHFDVSKRVMYTYDIDNNQLAVLPPLKKYQPNLKSKLTRSTY